MKKIINFGSLNIDHVYNVPHFVQPGETLSSSGYGCFCGGKGSNQSVALARAGAMVYHAGCIGKEGDFLKQNLAENGVNTELILVVDQPTGHAIIQVNPDGENAIVLFPGANCEISEEMIDNALAITNPGDLLLLQNEISDIALIMEKAVENELEIAFNFAPFSEQVATELPLHQVKLLIINETEGAGLSGKTETEAILDTLTKRYPDTTILLTLGAKGAICIDYGKRFQATPPPTTVVDTTCAGDTFIGFFLEAYTQGKKLDACLTTGCAAAAIAVSRHGASDSIPAKNEL
jgi:ribokinase